MSVLGVTASSGLQAMPTLPGLCVQIRNLQHLAEDHIRLSFKCVAESFPNSLCLVAAVMVDFQHSGQTTGSLDGIRQDMGSHTGVRPTWAPSVFSET